MEYTIGDRVRGKVTGIQPYGVFVELDEQTQGLIHISEVKHAYVKDLHELFEVGEDVDVMIMDIDEYSKKISLSIRSMIKAVHHPFSNPRKNPRFDRKRGIGFDTVAEKMPCWIDTALKEISEQSEE